MKANKIILITAAALVVIGLITAGLSILMLSLSDDFKGELQTQAITENINEINVSANIGDIRIICGNTEIVTVTYYKDNTNQYYISTIDDILMIKSNTLSKNLKWYDQLINLSFITKDKYDLIIKLPRNKFANFKVSNEYGNIEAQDVFGGYLNFETNCGDIELNNCEFTNIACITDYGNIEAETITTENINFETNCGDIELNSVSGKQIILNTDLGDIQSTILGNESDYSVNAETNLGDKNIQNSSKGTKILNVKSDLGDIDIKFQ